MTTNPHNLTDQELAVLKGIAAGRCTKELAGDLHISPKTVEYYRAQLQAKLNIHDTASLTRFAMKNKLVTEKPPAPPAPVVPFKTTSDLAQALLNGAAQAANGTADVLQLNALCNCSDALIRLARLQMDAEATPERRIAWIGETKK